MYTYTSMQAHTQTYTQTYIPYTSKKILNVLKSYSIQQPIDKLVDLGRAATPSLSSKKEDSIVCSPVLHP